MTHPRRTRTDGWTLARRKGFIDALAKTGNVRAAAEAVGMSAQTAYRLRKRDSGFAAAWDATCGQRIEQFHDLALDRLEHGNAVPLLYHGRVVGYRIEQDDRLLMAMLRSSTPPSRKRLAGEFHRTAVDKVTERREKLRNA